jgi:hypothetical protein
MSLRGIFIKMVVGGVWGRNRRCCEVSFLFYFDFFSDNVGNRKGSQKWFCRFVSLV